MSLYYGGVIFVIVTILLFSDLGLQTYIEGKLYGLIPLSSFVSGTLTRLCLFTPVCESLLFHVLFEVITIIFYEHVFLPYDHAFEQKYH